MLADGNRRPLFLPQEDSSVLAITMDVVCGVVWCSVVWFHTSLYLRKASVIHY